MSYIAGNGGMQGTNFRNILYGNVICFTTMFVTLTDSEDHNQPPSLFKSERLDSPKAEVLRQALLSLYGEPKRLEITRGIKAKHKPIKTADLELNVGQYI